MSNKIHLTETLPSAFNDAENKKHFKRLQAGDERARDTIKEHNLRLVVNIINKNFYNVEEIDKNELYSLGVFGLNKAVDTFDINKGIKFSTYAGRVISNEILMTLRKLKKSKNDISLESIIHEDKNGETLTLKNIMALDEDLEENYINEELKQGVRKSLEILTERERTVVELYYGFRGELYNHRQIGQLIGLSTSYISRIDTSALKKISEYLISEGLIERRKVRLESEPVKKHPSEEKVLMYAKAITEDNIDLDELSLKTGASTQSIKTLISRRLPSLDNDLYIKVKGILEMKEEKVDKLKSEKETKGKTLLTIFIGYSETQIDNALEKLNEEEKEMLLLRYPLYGEKQKTLNYIAQKYDIKPGSINAKLNSIIKKVNKALEGQTINREKTIFEYFENYSKEQVMTAIASLTDESKNIIELKYGLNGNPITSNVDIAKLYGTNSNTMNGRIYAIKKSIQTRLEKMNKKEEIQTDSLKLGYDKVEQIKKSILENTFNEEETIYNINDIKIETQKIETTCLIAGKDNKRNILDRIHSMNNMNKNCFVYVIRIINSDNDLLFENILVQDIKTGKFYRFINKYENGEYNISSMTYGELVCYDIVGVHAKKLKKIEDIIESKPVVNTSKTEEIKTLPKYTLQEIEQAESCFKIGIKLFNQRQFIKAQKEFLKALASGETYTLQKTNYYLGKIELVKKKPIIAEKYLSASLEYNAKDYYTLLELGRSLSMQGKFEEARICFDKCSKIKTKHIEPIIEQAKNLIRQNKYEEALKQYDRAIAIRQNDYYTYLEKGELLYDLKRYVEAKKVLTVCNKLKLDKKFHNRTLGKIAYLEGDEKQARALFDELLASNSKANNIIDITNIGFFFHSIGEKELAYEYYSKYPVFKKWFNLSEKTIIEHIYKHMSNRENETMHSVFNFPISINLLNELIKDMDKTSIAELYDVYQIHCENAGYMVIDEDNRKREDYITIKTLPFTKKVMLAYPDYKLPNVEVTKSVNLEDLLNFGKKVEVLLLEEETKPVETVEEKDVTVITDNSKNIIDCNFEQCRNQVKMFINMLSDPTEQVVLLLRLGYVRNQNYTESQIAKFLNISEEEVKNIINKSLSNLTSISSSTLNWLDNNKTFQLTQNTL